MKTPQYITTEDVQRACRELGMRDWSELQDGVVSLAEAQAVLAVVNVAGMPIQVGDFRDGLQVELEHGIRFEDANVTSNHPVLTGKIVLAHMKESLNYYRYLEVAELESDLVKATVAGDATLLMAKHAKLVEAKRELAEAVCALLAQARSA